MNIVSKLDFHMASVDLINIYNNIYNRIIMCPLSFFCSRSPRKNIVQFRFENEPEAVLIKSLGEERQIWPGRGHMTVQNLDFKVLCMDVDSSLWRCAEGKASVCSSNGGALKMVTYHQSDFTIHIWLDDYNKRAGVSYLVDSSGFCMEVSHMASSMVRYTFVHTV